MKEFILFLVLIATPLSAEAKSQFVMNDVQFKSCGKECVEVKTRTVTYRVYACGKLQKLTWDELNPNEENSLQALNQELSSLYSTALSGTYDAQTILNSNVYLQEMGEDKE